MKITKQEKLQLFEILYFNRFNKSWYS